MIFVITWFKLQKKTLSTGIYVKSLLFSTFENAIFPLCNPVATQGVNGGNSVSKYWIYPFHSVEGLFPLSGKLKPSSRTP